jgi:RNA polymerase sigma-32 factor
MPHGKAGDSLPKAEESLSPGTASRNHPARQAYMATKKATKSAGAKTKPKKKTAGSKPKKAAGRSQAQTKAKKTAGAKAVEPEVLEAEELEQPSGLDGLAEEAYLPVRAAQGPAPPVPVDPLQRYLWEVRHYNLLTREEEEILSKRYHETGDPDAAARLVTSNLRLVVKVAMEHQRYWTRSLLDLIQEGNIGLLQAVKKFDPFRGIKFSYYASFWIKAYILKFIMDNWRLVKLGTTQAQRKLFYNLRKEKEKLKSQGINPEPKLLSTRLGVTEAEVVEMQQRLDGWELSLDAPVRETSDEPQQSFLPDDQPSAEDRLVSGELKQLFHDRLFDFRETLDDKEKDIFDQRLMAESPVTLNDLGKVHGISRERVRQLQVRLMDKLREYMRDHITDFDDQFSGLSDEA